MLSTRDLPPPPATPPSAIAAMLNLLEPHLGRSATTFTTIDFIGRFSMTALEGHQRLNELAADGLLASVPGRIVETWQLTRDGAYVFGPERKRVTKKFVTGVMACLKTICAELLRQGVVEVSVGGRPMDGKPTGQVLVGLRLKNVPFASPDDDALLQQLCTALDATVGTAGYAVMLFSEKVPFRLRERTVIGVNDAAGGALRASDDLVDEDESEQSVWHARFRALHNLSASYSSFSLGSGLPWGLHNVLEIARITADLPLRGSLSGCAPDDGAILRLGAVHADTFDKDDRRWEDWSTELFATLECRSSTNSLQAFFEEVQNEEVTTRSFYRLKPFFEMIRWPGEFERAAAHALLYYRAHLAKMRAASAARVKPKLEPLFLTFFDTLNFGSPRVIGFVRQPAGHNAHIDALVDKWDSVLEGVEGAASACLTTAGHLAGSLSLDVREATADEVAVFQEACKRENTTFRYWLFLPNNRMACLPMGRLRYAHVERDTPEVFQIATLGRPVWPRLIAPSRYGRLPELKDVVRAAEPRARAALEHNLAFIDEVSMLEFARNAALQPCSDRTVLSSEVLSAWIFSAGQGDGWRARSDGDGWSVELNAQGKNLDLTLTYGRRTETHRLAPYEVKHEWGRAYDGTLAALLGLFSAVRLIRETGQLPIWSAYPRKFDDSDEAQVFSSLAHELSLALRRDNNYAWPYFEEHYESSNIAVVPAD